MATGCVVLWGRDDEVPGSGINGKRAAPSSVRPAPNSGLRFRPRFPLPSPAAHGGAPNEQAGWWAGRGGASSSLRRGARQGDGSAAHPRVTPSADAPGLSVTARLPVVVYGN